MRKCYDCKQEKELDLFCKDKEQKDGHKYICKDCQRVRSRAYEQTRERKDRFQTKAVKGFTKARFESMNEAQKGLCKICQQSPKKKRLSVDHCHQSNQIRGLLCEGCNLGLGHFKDNPEILARAIAYLSAFK